MIILLFIIPLLAAISAVLIYRLNGKLELFKLDLVQFFYAFVMAPFVFVWGKSFLFLILKNEIEIVLPSSEIFLFDTLFSLLFLFVYAFVVMHSLTKSINLKVAQDPLYDIFRHSEYFHLWLTHLVMFVGGMGLLTLLAVFNAIFPLDIYMNKIVFHSLSIGSVFLGFFIFIGIWLSDPKQKGAYFMRIMKLSYGIFFLVHAMMYFIFDPKYNSSYSLFWSSSIVFATAVTCSFFTYRSTRAKNTFEKFSERFKHGDWEFKAQLFNKKKGK